MANPYDDIVGSWQQETNRAPLTTAPNPYDAVVGEIANERQTRTRAIFEKALAVNPDQAAETQKLTRTTGLPFSVIDRNFTEAKRREQARMLDLARLSQDSPILARQLLDPTFTSQTHDHLENLSTLEQTFNVVRAVPAGAARGVGTLLSGSGQLIDIGARNIGLTAVSRAVRDLTGADPGIALDVAGSLKFAGSGWKMLADAIGPDKEAQNFATDVAGGIGQLIQQIGVQIATGGMSSLFSLFSQGADVMADKTQGDKASQAMRDTAVLTGASITALTEKYGIDALLNRVPPAIKNSALRWIADKLVAGGIEATQEITEGVLQDVVRKLLTNPDATIGDGSLYEASVAGTSAAIVRAALGVRTRGAQEVQKGQQAERDANNLKAQFDLAAQALLRERNPDEFRTLVQTMADNTDGAPKEIYVDAEVLNQLAPEVLNQLPQSVRDALPDALAANDVVAISTGDVLTIAPGTPLEQVLIENARIGDPMAMSQKEAKDAGSKAQEFLAQEAQRVIQQASDQQAMQASSDRVKQTIFEGLNAIGRDRPAVNETTASLYASLYTTLAAELNMTPEQAWAAHGVKYVGQTGQGSVLNAGGKVGEIAVEGFNFGKSNRTTLSGSNFGRGLAGNNRDLYLNAADKRLSKRIYFYVDKGTGINPEAGVGGIARKFNLTNVYDGDTDPLRLKTGRDQLGFESAVLDAGFSGYLDRMSGTQSGQVILLGDQTVTGELLGPTTRTTGKVVPEKGDREARGRDVIVDALNADKTLPSGSPTLARWQELLAKNPEVLQALTDAGVFAGDQTRTAFKSNLIKAYQDATPAESYAQSLTTMVPSTKGAVVDPTDVKVPSLEAADQPDEKSQKALEANVNTFDKKEQTIADKPKRGYDSIKVEGNTLRERAESIITQMVRNLRTIFNAIPESIRQRSKLWYDGANRISLAFSDRYNLTPMQTAGQLAVTSPQADWYMNVSYVERINDILAYRQDHTWDSDMETWAENWINSDTQVEGRAKEAARRQQAIRDAVREERAAQRAVDKAKSDLEKNTPKLDAKIAETEAALAESEAALKAAKKTKDDKAIAKAQKLRDKRNEEAKTARGNLREAKSAISKAETALRNAGKTTQEKRDYAAEPDANLEVQALIRGKKLSELTTDFERAWWVRAYDEAHNPRSYRVVSPEGGFLDFAKLEDGTTNDSIGWKSFNAIAKAISIHRDGSVANITAQLGGEHKVRNFYNNIFAPHSATPFVTSDTHQVAANLFLPLGADALEVGQNFGGTGSKSVGATGLNGTYWLYHEAVVRAAKAEGVKPREMQSISWEAIRNLFSPSFKADLDSVNAVRDLWVKYQNGNATYEDTIRDIVDLAGGKFRDPAWVGVRPDSTAAPEDGSTSYESGLAHARSGDQRREQPAPGDAGDAGQNVPTAGDVNGRLEQAGDGGRRNTGGGYPPLAGAPAHAGATGPIAGLVAVAEQYARDNGIDLKRQAEYVQVDPDLGKRIAKAYAAMEHAPNDPRVQATYDALIRETRAQYDALVAAGYTFTFFDKASDPYKGNPWGAMRDIRDNKTMAVYGTYDGYGNEVTGFETDKNLLVVPTGLQWPDQAGVMRDVTANDLFRAVHDAFGHGLEGAGFRGTGEANAFEAHARLYSPAAMMALTNETRAQNSWLNLNPDLLLDVVGYAKASELHPDNWQAISVGEHNQTADVDDTIFADQKNGVLPEWTWTEGRAGDQSEVLNQSANQTDTPEFKAWFGDSKVVDANGQPLVVYHGTEKPFTKVNMKKGAQGVFWVSSDRAAVENGEVGAAGSGAIMELYARVENPAGWKEYEQFSLDELRGRGYDGVILPDPDGSFVAIVFDPNQVKSATRNNGEFSTKNDSILRQGKKEPRGTFSPKTFELALNKGSDMSTVHHEMAHAYLEIITKIASEPNAPQGIVDQVERFLKWRGIPDLATWNALPLKGENGKEPHHEALAENYENYLLTGKAPSVELQPLFRKLRAYMLNAYKTLKAFFERNPNVEQQVPPEMVQFYDRMLASEAQIAEANEVAGLLPNEEADAEANERLTARSLRDLKWTVGARAREIKKLQAQAKEQRKEVEAEVTAEVNQMPEFQAKAALDAIRKDTKAPPSDADLAVVADSFGYPDADAMLQAIDAVGKKSDVIEGMTDQRMLEQYGDLIDQRAIEAAANEAVHNEARARSLATELRSQAEMLNPRTDTGRVNAQGSRITVNALVEAAKQFAANVISRTPLKDLKAKAWQHTAAERRAGKRWAEATAKGETQEAVKAKQDQMLNNAAAKAAIDAQAEMRKYLTFFKRVIKDNNEKVVEKGRDPDVVNAARAVLAAYGVAPKAGKTALEYLALVEKNDPAMFAALQPSVQGALNLAQPLDALTMDELRGLHEEIQAMWHLAKRSRQMEVDGNLLDIEDAETELQDRMQEIGVPDTMPGDTGAVTPREELARKLQYAGSILRRVEQWAQGMGSAFTKLVFQPVKEAADRYRADRVVYRKRYQALVDAVAPALTKGLIAAPELNYTFGEGHNGIGHAELLHAILHTGNASNKRKLLLGRNWATENADGTLNTDRWDAFLQRMHDTGVLTKAHYDFAQGVWDLLEQTKPLAQKTHRDVFGRYFAEVTADSFDTPFGSYTGGYVPAQADPRIVQDADLRKLAEAENENMSFSFPSTNKGFTKGRVEYNRPLMLDLRTIGQHLDKVLLFAHMEPAVRDVNKLLSRKGVSYSLGRIDPTIYAGMLTPWLSRSARQVVETPAVGDGGISRVMSAARSRAGMALMFANVSNTLQQLTGFSVAAIKVKPASLMRATATFIASPKQTAKTVADASTFMANRMENEIAAVNDAMDAILLDPNLYEKSQAWTQKHAYFLQTAMANTMEPIIWTAAYNDAITRGDSDRDAVRHADSVIRTTQGSTLPEDVSRLETGPAWARLFTQFIGYFNMLANTNATALLQVSREMGLKKGAGKALGIITLGMLAPIWVAEAIAHAMRGGPEDEDKDGYLDDWLMAVFGMGTIKGTFAMVPFLGQAAQLTVNKFNDNPADDKFSLSPAVSLIESTVSAPFSVYKAIAEDGNRQKAVRDVASAVSIATGLPAFAVARPLGYLAGVEQGKVEPTDALDLARGLVSGTASPASK